MSPIIATIGATVGEGDSKGTSHERVVCFGIVRFIADARTPRHLRLHHRAGVTHCREPIEHVRLATPFLLRTVEPPIASVEGRGVRELRRIGKRIVIGVEPDLWLVLHLMIAKAAINWRPSIFRMALSC